MSEKEQIEKAEKTAGKSKKINVKETWKLALMERERRRERIGDHVSHERVDEIN